MNFLPKLTPGNVSVGLDIGSASIKLVQLQQTRDGVALRKAGSAPTPEGAVKGGVVVDPLQVAKAIQALLEALQIERAPASVAIAGPTVVVREVPLPAMSDRQLRKSIQWEARNYMSFPVEDSVVEFEVMERPETASGGAMKVMLVAAPRDMVDSQVETVEIAGLEPLAVEVQSFAAIRGLGAANGNASTDEPGETTALLGIGASYTDITILKDNEFVLTRIIPIAGNSFTEAVKNALEVETDEANQLKESTMQVVMSEEERATLDPETQQASRAIEPLLDELIREVRRSLAYHDFQQQSPDAGSGDLGVNRLLLSGGSARLPRMDEYFQAQLGVPVEVINVFGPGQLQAKGVNHDYLQNHAPTLLIGVGLALRELSASGRRNNHSAG